MFVRGRCVLLPVPGCGGLEACNDGCSLLSFAASVFWLSARSPAYVLKRPYVVGEKV